MSLPTISDAQFSSNSRWKTATAIQGSFALGVAVLGGIAFLAYAGKLPSFLSPLQGISQMGDIASYCFIASGGLSAFVSFVVLGMLIRNQKELKHFSTKLNNDLIRAVANGKTEWIQFFIEHGANRHVKDEDDRSLLGVAILHNKLESLKELLAQGVDPNQKNNNGIAPLHHAILVQKSDMALALIQHEKTDLNLQDDEGNTPLHLAVQKGDLETIELLLEFNSVKKDLQNSNQQTPFDIAKANNNQDAIDLFTNPFILP